MRLALTAVTLCAIALPAAARALSRDLMADFDTAWARCRELKLQGQDRNPACQQVKAVSRKLEAGGMQLVPNPDSPTGMNWEPQ